MLKPNEACLCCKQKSVTSDLILKLIKVYPEKNMFEVKTPLFHIFCKVAF